MTNMAFGVRVLLNGDVLSAEARKKAVKRSMKAGLIAGITELII